MTDFLKWALSLTGHIGIWSLLFNVLHATAFSRPGRKLSEKVVLLAVFGPVVWVLVQWIQLQSLQFERIYSVSPIAYYYGWTCLVIGVFFVGRWAWRRITDRDPWNVVRSTTELIDVQAGQSKPLLHETYANLLGKIPGNQSTLLAVERKLICIPSLPEGLNHLKIAHLSDLHFTGQIGPEFFEEVVDQTNAFEPDIIALTGDIIDEIECLPWIREILGELEAKHGKFYVLGNHDLRIKDEGKIREEMAAIGFVGLQDSWFSLPLENATLQLAGNELPWFAGARELPDAQVEDSEAAHVFKLLLSHSPDQFRWAINKGFGLMLAGHTHGGQIRFPILGPVIAPSRYGVKYCSGTFAFGDLLMHVSRGLSGDDPIRINCPPELGLLTLHKAGRPRLMRKE